MDKPQPTQTTAKPGQRVPKTHPASATTTDMEDGRRRRRLRVPLAGRDR